MAQQMMELDDRQRQWLSRHGISEPVWHALTTSVHPGADPRSVMMYWEYCRARELDPLKKPAHIVPMYVTDQRSGKKEWRDVVMPGIAEYRITANRTGLYAGQDAPEFGPLVDFDFGGESIVAPESCTVTVYRLVKGVGPVGYSHTEYFEECAQTLKDGTLNSMWRRRRRGQLAKTAEAGALRKAFPEELGGAPTAEEMTPGAVYDGGAAATDVFAPKAEAAQLARELQPEAPASDNVAVTAPEPEPEPEEPEPEPADNPDVNLGAQVLSMLGQAQAASDQALLDEAVDLTREITDERQRETLIKHATRIQAKLERAGGE